jgi:Protein of unknown function (DUF3486)
MPQKSFAKRLPKDLRAELDARIMDGRLSVDAVWEWLQENGVETSRSAVGRHMQHVEDAASEMRKAREMAGVFAQKLGPDVLEGSIGTSLIEVAQSIVFRQLMPKLANKEEEDKDTFEDLMFMASAVQKLQSAQKGDVDRVLKIKKETVVAAAEAAVGEAKSRGLNAETVAAIRAKVLGVAS